MKKLTTWLEEKVYPITMIIQENKYLASIQYGIMLTIPLLLVGAFACVISDFPFAPFQEFMYGVFGDAWYEWNWDVLNPATFGLIGIITMTGMSYELSRRNQVQPLTGITISFMNFFLLMKISDGMFSMSELGASSLFLVMIVSIFSVQLYTFCVKKKLTIKMAEGIPSFVADQFAALIPAAISAVVFIAIRYLIQITPFETASNLIYGLVQAPLTSIGTSLPGTIVVTFLNSFLWLFGIHGTNVIDSVMSPLWYSARAANLAVYQANALAIRPFIVTQDFANMIIFLTGTGITLPMCIEMVFCCKSKRMKTVGKGAIIPGIFNVNEPVIFGLPIVMNPVLVLPFIISPVVCVLIAYFAMHSGMVPYPTGITVPWTMPAFIGGWMMCGNITGGLLQLVILLVSGGIYYPFVMTLDKKYCEEEAEKMENRTSKETIIEKSIE